VLRKKKTQRRRRERRNVPQLAGYLSRTKKNYRKRKWGPGGGRACACAGKKEGRKGKSYTNPPCRKKGREEALSSTLIPKMIKRVWTKRGGEGGGKRGPIYDFAAKKGKRGGILSGLVQKRGRLYLVAPSLERKKQPRGERGEDKRRKD